MKRSKKRNIDQSSISTKSSSNFFRSLRKKPRISIEERMFSISCRKFVLPELCKGLMEDLGDQYTEEIAEKAFQDLLEDLKKEGVFDRWQQRYLELKIQDERADAELQRQEAADKPQPE